MGQFCLRVLLAGVDPGIFDSGGGGGETLVQKGPYVFQSVNAVGTGNTALRAEANRS